MKSQIAIILTKLFNAGEFARNEEPIEEATLALLKIFNEAVGKDKYLLDNLPLMKDEDYLDKCVKAKDVVDGYNQAKQEIRQRLGELK